MKNIITIIFITLMTYSLYAQVPGIGQVPLNGFKYQAVARNAQGLPINGETVALRFTILQGSADGTAVFVEQQSASTNDVGLFDLVIGEVNNTDFINIDWRLGNHFLKVELNDNGWKDLGTHQLLSVPYAMTAGNGKLISSVDAEIITTYGANGNANTATTSQATGNHGQYIVLDDEGEGRGWLFSNGNSEGGTGNILLRGENGTENARISTWASNNNGGFRLSDDAGQWRALIASNGASGGAGTVNLRGENGESNVVLGVVNNTDTNFGLLRVLDDEGDQRITMWSAPNRNGSSIIDLRGENNSLNVAMGPTNNDNHGRIWVYDASGVKQAGLEVLDDGQGRMFADVKNFRMDHPKDTEKEIWYASIEGPEAAAYERGTSQLVNGEARVDFSEHFELVVNPETVTFVLTPRSAASKGLAIVEQTATGFTVKELLGGTGTYDFDWRVEGVRKGYEDFEVIRDKKEMERMLGIEPTSEVQESTPSATSTSNSTSN